jgi:phage shock protein PspC (stress-responsive transcriptional regulator)
MPLYRSRRDSIIGGVCGGIAEAIGWSATRVRVLYVLVSILSAAFPGAFVYVILWIVIPRAPET